MNKEVKIDDIKVDLRIRKEFGDIDGLATSIAHYGLLHPIIVDKDLHLIAGERRLKAHQKLGKKTIEVRFKEDLSIQEKLEIELEENIHRKSLTWQEEVDALARLHDLKRSIHGSRVQKRALPTEGDQGWGIKDTATALDKSTGGISMDIALAKAVKMFPVLAKEKTKDAARKKFRKLQENLLREEMAKRRGKRIVPNVIHGDCVAVTKKMKDESFDMILADFPFGIDVQQSHGLGKRGKETIDYDDSEYGALELFRKAVPELYRVLKKDRHAIFFFAMTNYMEFKKILENVGFVVENVPLIWNKESGSSAATGEVFTYAYEPMFWCRKGKRLLNNTYCNVFTEKRVPSNKKYHPNEKPLSLLRLLLDACTFPGESVYDPVGGSGSTLAACMETDRECTTCEKDKNYYERILDRVEEINKNFSTSLEEEDTND
jgi:DNA modification methylase